MKAELKRRPSGRQIRTWASHCFLFADSKDKGCHLPKTQTQSIWPFLDETILLCMKHYKTCFRFLICEQIRLGLELKAFEPLAVQGSRRDAHLCSPFTFEQQSRRGDGRFSFALIPATECSKNCTKLEQFNTNIIDHFICYRTLRICSDLTFAMAARALVDIFNGLDNATETQRDEGYKQALNFRRTQALLSHSFYRKFDNLSASSSVEITLTSIAGTRPQSCGETPKSPKLYQEAPGNNGPEFRLKFLAFVVRLSS